MKYRVKQGASVPEHLRFHQDHKVIWDSLHAIQMEIPVAINSVAPYAVA
jgi:hypothetical protein